MTIDKTKKLLDELLSTSPVDLKSLYPTEVLIANKLRPSCPQMSEEELQEYSKEVANNGSYLATEVEAERTALQGKIDSFISAVPITVVAQANSIACAAVPTAAAAAPGILAGACMNAKSLKSTAIEILQGALSAGIELPDSIGTMIETLKPILAISL